MELELFNLFMDALVVKICWIITRLNSKIFTVDDLLRRVQE